ncbi:TorD/DmsD family molecular chaperone [Providencia burhodogranariea]|uniref:Twin-arginine leader-binding protein dmsd n=1 Tax=Providencia burhodogranariea DSM 19968 TaxID=1141662 RepID=K8X2N8_9GAMM|nr:molecular chaperone [Providencia burhodogranariea]EKT63917.1 twin-arginine leader-binding protein dmsd [Providencia burhodogranariea DSM 19968]
MVIDTTLARILGACFYYSPQSETISQLIPVLAEIPSLYDWDNADELVPLCLSLSQQPTDTLNYDFSVLFEGQGIMPAPPWGSVYLEHDNTVMGASTADYRQFLMAHGLTTDTGIREPEDQFGLMMMAISALCEQEQTEAAISLLEQHLLPWAYRYLTLVQETPTEHAFYSQLALISEQYLRAIEQHYNLSPTQAELFR